LTALDVSAPGGVILNLEPVQHIVRSGESLSSIAQRYHLTDWTIIYDDPHNAAFRQQRPAPDLIVAGDVVFVPVTVGQLLWTTTELDHLAHIVHQEVENRTAPGSYLNVRATSVEQPQEPAQQLIRGAQKLLDLADSADPNQRLALAQQATEQLLYVVDLEVSR